MTLLILYPNSHPRPHPPGLWFRNHFLNHVIRLAAPRRGFCRCQPIHIWLLSVGTNPYDLIHESKEEEKRDSWSCAGSNLPAKLKDTYWSFGNSRECLQLWYLMVTTRMWHLWRQLWTPLALVLACTSDSIGLWGLAVMGIQECPQFHRLPFHKHQCQELSTHILKKRNSSSQWCVTYFQPFIASFCLIERRVKLNDPLVHPHCCKVGSNTIGVP